MPRPLPNLRLRALLPCLLGLLQVGCLEISLNGDLRLDGSGTIAMHYVILKEVFEGKYGEIEKNRLLPLSEEDVNAFVDSFPGAKLEGVHVQDNDDVEIMTDVKRKVGFRTVAFKMSVADVNAISTNHIRLAYFPYGDNAYFQFRIDKDISSDARTDADRFGSVNPFGDMLLAGRNLTVQMTLPAKILRSNGVPLSWSTIRWDIPLTAIVGDVQESIVAWAEMPLASEQKSDAFLNRFKAIFPGQSWRDPADLPLNLLDNPKFNQSVQE